MIIRLKIQIFVLSDQIKVSRAGPDYTDRQEGGHELINGPTLGGILAGIAANGRLLKRSEQDFEEVS